MSQSGVLKRSTILVHGSVGMPLAIIGYPLVVYLPPFYTQEIGLHMALMAMVLVCLLYTSPSPRDRQKSRMPSSA